MAREAREQSPVREDPVFDEVEEEAVPEVGGEEVDQTVSPVAQPAAPTVAIVVVAKSYHQFRAMQNLIIVV